MEKTICNECGNAENVFSVKVEARRLVPEVPEAGQYGVGLAKHDTRQYVGDLCATCLRGVEQTLSTESFGLALAK